MAYRKRKIESRKLKNMREVRLRKIAESDPPEYPISLPELRRQIIVRDFDFGTVEHVINLFKENRIDTYRMEVDGRLYAIHIGWSRVLEIIRKQFLRVHTV